MKYETLADVFKDFEWCQGSAFRDEIGKPCQPSDAKQCCILGAVMIVKSQIDSKRVADMVYCIISDRLYQKFHFPVQIWNDSFRRTKEEVLKVASTIDVRQIYLNVTKEFQPL